MVERFPLAWPQGRPRRPPSSRKDGRFNTKRQEKYAHSDGYFTRSSDLTIAQALSRLQAELDRIGAKYVVLSSNLETRLDGIPRSGQRPPDDPGVAVYFQLSGKPHCLPCDTYTKVEANIAAIAAHIEAGRAQERHGVASIAEIFSGFAALPAPNSIDWRSIFAKSAAWKPTRDELNRVFRERAEVHHPDRGGSTIQMAELSAARDAAMKELFP